MTKKRVVTEQGVVIGNVYDKYGSKNPIVQWLMQGFEDALSDLVAMSHPASIHEIGCGEGHWVRKWRTSGIAARGCDFSSQVIDVACCAAAGVGMPTSIFTVKSIYDLEPDVDAAELVVCCEVLEHLENPEAGLLALQRVVDRHLILSVPREPLWRILNMARGKYLLQGGNTPGHLQHWSPRAFSRLVARHFEIIECRQPLPWTMLLCSPRR